MKSTSPDGKSGTYTVVRNFESHSRPGHFYTVKRHHQTGALSCDCPGWIYSKSDPRTCPHVRAILGQPRNVKAYRQAIADGALRPAQAVLPAPAKPDYHQAALDELFPRTPVRQPRKV